MTDIRLLEDHHVHSTFSDGKSTLEENIERCETLGLTHLGCVDHVRRDSMYVGAYAAAVRAAQSSTSVRLTVGVEAKILDSNGTLDLPDMGMEAVDRVYVADHQFPWEDGPRSPRLIREAIERDELGVDECVTVLVNATIRAVRGYSRHPIVLAHLFSILPKVGLTELDVSDEHLVELAASIAEPGATVEISERWGCPSVRTMRAMHRAGVSIVCSTDSHAADTIGRYDYVARVLSKLEGDA